MRAAVRELRARLRNAKRRLLLTRAHSLGGSDRVRQWIGLHETESKKSELEGMAAEMQYV